jgi:ATP-binding cassette subfamily C protein LapB
VAGKKADTIMASKLFQQVMGMALVHKPTSVGAFSTIMREFETVRDFFTSATMTTLVDIPFVILFLFLIYYLGGILVYIPLAMIPLVLICALLIETPLKRVVKESLTIAAQKNSVLVESLSGLEVIKAMGAEGVMQHKWEGLVGAHALFGLRSRFLSSIVVNVTNYAQQLVSIGIVVLGVYEIMSGNLTLGALIACNILGARSLAPLGPLANLLTRYQQARSGLIDLNHLMSLPLDREENKQFLHHPNLKGDIELDDVSFSYPRQETNALEHVSFKIKAGEKVGIIGRIGSGKSTLHKMILGLYHPASGKISIDNANILQIDPLDLRRNIGYVAQDCMLFRGNIRENIVMTQPWADDEAVLNIAKMTGADRFISQHPFGYDLHVGERGETLSGGQRQAITIARALLPNPPIILLDEPSNAMDDRSEKELLEGLMPYMKEKTLLLVTHKPSLLALVDRVIVFDKGRVIYDGPKEGLTKPS